MQKRGRMIKQNVLKWDSCRIARGCAEEKKVVMELSDNYIHYMYSGVNQVTLVGSNDSFNFPTGSPE